MSPYNPHFESSKRVLKTFRGALRMYLFGLTCLCNKYSSLEMKTNVNLNLLCVCFYCNKIELWPKLALKVGAEQGEFPPWKQSIKGKKKLNTEKTSNV